MVSRGIRNNNPLNIRKSSERWEGLCRDQKDTSFCQFIDPEWGIRAAYRILCTYNKKHYCKTLGAIISRWAPPTENDTLTYIKFVCSVCRCEPEKIIDVDDIDFMAKLIMAMTRMENGSCPYTIDQIKKGISLKDAKCNS